MGSWKSAVAAWLCTTLAAVPGHAAAETDADLIGRLLTFSADSTSGDGTALTVTYETTADPAGCTLVVSKRVDGGPQTFLETITVPLGNVARDRLAEVPAYLQIDFGPDMPGLFLHARQEAFATERSATGITETQAELLTDAMIYDSCAEGTCTATGRTPVVALSPGHDVVPAAEAVSALAAACGAP